MHAFHFCHLHGIILPFVCNISVFRIRFPHNFFDNLFAKIKLGEGVGDEVGEEEEVKEEAGHPHDALSQTGLLLPGVAWI